MKQPRKQLLSIVMLWLVVFASDVSRIIPVAANDESEYHPRLLESTAEHLTLEFEVPEYWLETEFHQGLEYQRVAYPGVTYTSQAGAPRVPQASALIGIPAGAKVDLKVLLDDHVEVDRPVSMPPAGTPVQLSEDFQPGEYGYIPDKAAYSSTELYPAQPVQLGEDAWLRDQRILRVIFYPFQYVPASGLIRWHQRLRVEVRFVMPESLGVTGPDRQDGWNPFENALRQNLLNYEQARSWRTSWREQVSQPASFNTPQDTSTRYKVSIDQDGIYRLGYSALHSAGLDVLNLDPTTFRLTNQGDEVAIYVHNSDGAPNTFSPGEYILFFGQKFTGERMAARFTADDDLWLGLQSQLPDGSYTTWQPQMNAAMLEKYTDQNVYWLSYGGAPGARMALASGAPGSAAVPASFRDTVRAEQSRVWKTTLFTSEDTWFWQKIVAVGTINTPFTTTLSAPASDSGLATIRGEVVAESYNDFQGPDHHITLYFNDPAHTQALLDDTWDGKSRYHFETSVAESSLVNGINQLDVQLSGTAAVPADTLYFDWFEVEYQRLFQAVNNQLIFSGGGSGNWKYETSGFSTWDLATLDITQPLSPIRYTSPVYAAGTLTFETSQGSESRYIVAAPQDLPANRIQAYTPPDLTQPADYVLITHASLVAAAQALADFHAARGLSTRVIDIDDLYNQFNDGIYNPIAIKRYLQYTFASWPTPPAYAALIGDGHWNFKSYPGYDAPPIFIPPYLSWIDPWQGEVDSANLLATVVGSDPLPDLSIARIPINSVQELNAVINKTIAYFQAPVADWQRSIIFASDNTPDPAGDFITATQQLIADYIAPGWMADRLFLDDYCDPQYVPCPPATSALIEAINQRGGLLLYFVGHGGINFWANEQLLSNSDVPLLANGSRLPVVLSMDCLDGYWYHPNLTVASKSGPGLIEEMLRSANRGAVAAFAPTGLGVSTGHEALQRGYFDALFRDGEWRLGPATIAAKIALYATNANYDLIHTFTIFGDPALEMPSPYSMSVSPPEGVQAGAPGTPVTYTLNITNSSLITDTALIEVTGAWETVAPTITLPIAPGAETPLQIRVNIPAGAADNDMDTAMVTVTSQGDRRKTSSASLTTTAHPYGVSINPEFAQQFGLPGTPIEYALRVTNSGEFSDTFDLTISGNAWPVTPSQNVVGPLAPGQEAQLAVVVQLPTSMHYGQFDQATVRVVSRNDPARFSEAILRSGAHFMFLPHLRR